MISYVNEKLMRPTDLNQSYVKVIMISSFFVWALFNESYALEIEVFGEPLFRLLVIAEIYACLSLAYAKLFLPHKEIEYRNAKFIRYLGIFGDTIACTGAVYLAGPYGLLIYPVFITIVIGYGFRFGFRYFFVAEVLGLAALIWLVSFDLYLSQKPYLSGALLFGMLLIPTYSAFLLTKYQKILMKLEETNQARSRFIANMSHEFRTPLHAIMINAESLIESAPSLNLKDEFVKPLKIISESSSHLKVLVDRVLDIASSELRAFNLSPASGIDLFSLVTSSVEIGTAVARKKGLKVIYTMEPSVHRFSTGSKKEISEILINVLGNASKFTEQGRIAVHVKEEHHEQKENARRTIRIEIVDTGCGMTSNQLQSAFEPFVLGDDGSSRRYEGTGIGLTITRQYLEAMNGTINISSQVGLGTTVVIRIPCQIIKKEPTNQIVDFSRFTFISNAPGDEITELGVNVISYDGVNSSLENFERNDCILIDESLLERKDLRKLNAALLYSDIPIVMVGKSKAWLGWAGPEVRYGINQINSSTLADVAALCFGSSTPEKAEPRVEPLRNSQKILLIDDNENNLASAVLILRSAGHVVDAVTSGQAGISKMEQRTYDLVLIDMHMPKQNGAETLLLAREVISKQLPPIVFLTADVTAQVEIDASAAGISGFLTKPITPAALREAVDQYGAKSNFSGSHPRIQDAKKPHSSAYAEIDDMLERGISKIDIANLVDSFTADINQNLLQGAVFAAQDDKKQVRKLIHRMQGSAGAMHLSPLAERFAALEVATEEGICELYLASSIDLQILSDTLVKGMKNYLFDES